MLASSSVAAYLNVYGSINSENSGEHGRFLNNVHPTMGVAALKLVGMVIRMDVQKHFFIKFTICAMWDQKLNHERFGT